MLYDRAVEETSSCPSGSGGYSSYEGKSLFHLCSHTTLGEVAIQPDKSKPDHAPVTAYFSWGGNLQPESNALGEGSWILAA